ncbi:rfbP protein [Vibrio cholerae]|nr:rfbP protein [Vibrio cholerae]
MFKLSRKKQLSRKKLLCRSFFIVIPKPPLLAVVIVPRGFCPKMRPC